MKDIIRFELGIMQPGSFEKLICELMPRIDKTYMNIQPTFNSKGKTTKGCTDLHSYKEATGTYTVFICTTTDTNNSIQKKILSDINKLINTSCYIKDQIDEIVICLNTPTKTEEIIYRQECQKFGWKCILFSLENLTRKIMEYPDLVDLLCSKSIEQFKQYDQGRFMPNNELQVEPPIKTEKMFSCGHRISEIRNDINLSKSRFIDLIEFTSEKQLTEIENGELEVSESQIANICNNTGVSINWLKHSEYRKYDYHVIHTNETEIVNKIKQLQPNIVYFMIEPKSMSPLLFVHINNFNWRLYTFTFSIDFWNWFDDHYQISRIYKLFKTIHREFMYNIQGRIIDQETYDSAISGKIHISTLIKVTFANGQCWFDDLFDINHEYPISEDYVKWYGEWFGKLQDYFKQYLTE